jgi:DNA-binding IclR family transcriptional regulator
MKKTAVKSVPPKTAPRPPAQEGGDGVAAVERALALVAAIETADSAITLAELAVKTGFYKSTILRLLQSLTREGYVTRLPDGRYDLGPTAFRLGAAFERKNSIQHHVLPALQELIDLGTESASFHVRQDAETRLCLFRVNSHHPTLDRVEAGGIYPLRFGAAGHIILAYQGERGARYDAIRAECSNVSLGERDGSCAAVATPVFGPHNVLVGVISLSGPRERFGSDAISQMKQKMLPIAQRLTHALGGDWPGNASIP